MFKKIGAFLFALACSASYAIAADEPQSCYDECDAANYACVTAHGQNSGACRKIFYWCRDDCDAQNG
jgi:hypothetical protein